MSGATTAVMIGATVLATGVSVYSQMQAGQAAKAAGAAQNVAAQEQQQAANYQASELDTQAGQVQAASQRQAQAERERAALLISSDRAFAAGGGTTGSDPSVVSVEGQVGARGNYNALSDLYSGNEQAAGLTTQAALDRYSGQQYAQAGQYAAASGAYKNSMAPVGAAGTIFGGVAQGASMYAKYGMPGPNSVPNSAGTNGNYG